MGTRAQFFIGNPSDVANRQWLGCLAWDGYPDGDIGNRLLDVADDEDFRNRISMLAAKRDDFCHPATNSFPFPWHDDLYLTDFTYAFFDGRVQVTAFHGGWRDLSVVMADQDAEHWGCDAPDELPADVAAPIAIGPPGPDSIMSFSAKS